jgi:hypothetical protein
LWNESLKKAVEEVSHEKAFSCVGHRLPAFVREPPKIAARRKRKDVKKQ